MNSAIPVVGEVVKVSDTLTSPQQVLRAAIARMLKHGWVQGRYLGDPYHPFESPCCPIAAIWTSLGVDPYRQRDAASNVQHLGRETTTMLADYLVRTKLRLTDHAPFVEAVITFWNDYKVRHRGEVFTALSEAADEHVHLSGG